MREIKLELRQGKDEQSSKRIGYESYDPNFDGGAWYYVLDTDDIIQCTTYFPKGITDHLYRRQYTGLKDKNGKEIFEGDILKADWSVAKLNKPTNFNVFYASDKGSFMLHYRFSEYGVSFGAIENMEVIGNVWESPELLEAVKS